MEGGLPMLNCLLQHTLRSLCSCSDSSNSSKWVYAVFWRILPRNYPPPKWDYGGGALDRSKGNKRNWILVWEDGFCDFEECERAGSGYMKRFGADVFFKMSHEVYNYGEGLVGKIAAENSHKWVFRDGPSEQDPGLISSWNASIDPPRAWDFQFNSGIQTIAIISVREGVIQLGSFDKILEDLNQVISIQRKFGYIQSIPGIFALQRPYLPIIQLPNTHKPQTIDGHETAFSADDKRRLTGVKRLYGAEIAGKSPTNKSINLGWNSPQDGAAGPSMWSIPPLLPTMSCGFGALLSQFPSVIPSYNVIDAPDTALVSNNNSNISVNCATEGGTVDPAGGIAEIKVESSSLADVDDDRDEKPSTIKPNLGLEDEGAVELGFWSPEGGTETQSPLNLN
ncbi:uncharacterized protein LOC131162508 isoform X2 [Malania oleifera]|uniref:uncharacterized protein LOC131162508 isoform X2 n=1 Tax=Malania oleifera TaxID=397392 RepID=UPI0025ADAD1C|nr:uncharacterized protein LOC131162508 isoform X2 [Malania oleifera]